MFVACGIWCLADVSSAALCEFDKWLKREWAESKCCIAAFISSIKFKVCRIGLLHSSNGEFGKN